jgi:hypothetical protein
MLWKLIPAEVLTMFLSMNFAAMFLLSLRDCMWPSPNLARQRSRWIIPLVCLVLCVWALWQMVRISALIDSAGE